MEQQLTCPICYIKLENKYYTTECNHVFCNDCINEYLEHINTSFVDCPLCRQPIKNYLVKQTQPITSVLETEMLSPIDISYFNLVQSYSTTDRNSYDTFTFALQPINYQPTGHSNFSRI